MTAGPDRTAAVAAAQERARKASQASGRVSVITFRVTPSERTVLEAVARRQGESLSAYVRASALDVAKSIIESEGGIEEFVRRYGKELDARNTEQIQLLKAAAGSPHHEPVG